MNELLQAVDEFLTAQDMLDRQHTDTARKLRDRKWSVLNQVRRKYQRAAEMAEAQAALFAVEEAR